MEKITEWIAGSIIGIMGLITTWILAKRSGHKATHKDIYDKLDDLAKNKADKDEIKRIAVDTNNQLVNHMNENTKQFETIMQFVQSIDENFKILIQRLK